MARVRHPSLQARSGRYLEGQAVTAVTDRTTDLPATAYTTEGGSTPVTYPVYSGEEGEVQLWVAPGSYESTFSSDRVDTPAVWEGVLGVDTGDAAALVEAVNDAIAALEAATANADYPGLNVTTYGAVCDGREITATISASSTTLSSSTVTFTNADIGKAVLVHKAGAALSVPTGLSATAVGSGGFFSAGTYYYKIAAFVSDETTPSSEASATVVGSGKINLAWSAVTNATGYRIYRGTSSGAEVFLATVGAVTAWTDLGRAVFTGGGAPAGSNTSHRDLLTEIVSTSGGNATLADAATTAVSGGTAIYGTDNSDAFLEAMHAAANGGSYVGAGGELLVPPGDTTPEFRVHHYLVTKRLRWVNQADAQLRGIGSPSIMYLGETGNLFDIQSSSNLELEDLTLSPGNRWYRGDLLSIDNGSVGAPDPPITTLAAPMTNSQTTISVVDPLPPDLLLEWNDEGAIYVDWQYVPSTGGNAGTPEGMFISNIAPDRLSATVSRGKIGTAAISHAAGQRVDYHTGTGDCMRVKVRNINFYAPYFQPSVNAMLRINNSIFSFIDECAFEGVDGADWEDDETTSGYIILGNNQPNSNTRWRQGDGYNNKIVINRPVFNNGAYADILLSGSIEALKVLDPTFEPLRGGRPGAVRARPGTVLYGATFDGAWAGDVGAAGGAWFSGLASNNWSIINSTLQDPGGSGTANSSGYPIRDGSSQTYLANNYIVPGTDGYVSRRGASSGDWFITGIGNRLTSETVPWKATNNPGTIHIPQHFGEGNPGENVSPAVVRTPRIISATTYTAGELHFEGEQKEVIYFSSGSAITVTFPAVGSYTVVPPIGYLCEFVQYGAGQVTFTGSGGVSIRAPGGKVKSAAQYSTVFARKISATEWNLSGDIST